MSTLTNTKIQQLQQLIKYNQTQNQSQNQNQSQSQNQSQNQTQNQSQNQTQNQSHSLLWPSIVKPMKM